MAIKSINDVDIQNKTVVLREDLNVPIKNGVIQNDARINRALAAIEYALANKAAVIILSHLGRPEEGEYQAEFSLAPVADALSNKLNQPVRFERDWLDGVAIAPGEVVLCENVRFCKGEKANDEALAQKMAALGDVFVMDAFATAHRAHASTTGIAKYAKVAVAGPLLVAEMEALTKGLSEAEKPIAAIVGGAKVSSKLDVIAKLIEKVDVLILGGGIANTFLKAKGHEIGDSLCEDDKINNALAYLHNASMRGCHILLPEDVIVADDINSTDTSIRGLDEIRAGEKIFDIGPLTAEKYASVLGNCKTILFNGPVGVFEQEQFSAGTKSLAKAIAASSAFSIAGGGDTLSAIDKFKVANEISYISTGGGAFLEWVEGKILPGIAALNK